MNRTEPDEIARGIDPAVLTLLERGAPENGVDLADWWRTRESAELRKTTVRRHTATRFVGAFVAAGFLIGAVLGAAVGGRWGFGGRDSGVLSCKYSDAQRTAMKEVLAATGEARNAKYLKHCLELATCTLCHAELRLKPNKRVAPPGDFRQDPAPNKIDEHRKQLAEWISAKQIRLCARSGAFSPLSPGGRGVGDEGDANRCADSYPSPGRCAATLALKGRGDVVGHSPLALAASLARGESTCAACSFGVACSSRRGLNMDVVSRPIVARQTCSTNATFVEHATHQLMSACERRSISSQVGTV